MVACTLWGAVPLKAINVQRGHSGIIDIEYLWWNAQLKPNFSVAHLIILKFEISCRGGLSCASQKESRKKERPAISQLCSGVGGSFLLPDQSKGYDLISPSHFILSPQSPFCVSFFYSLSLSPSLPSSLPLSSPPLSLSPILLPLLPHSPKCSFMWTVSTQSTPSYRTNIQSLTFAHFPLTPLIGTQVRIWARCCLEKGWGHQHTKWAWTLI